MPNKDIILIGGGESSKIIISSVMRNLEHRVRGVLFIDHDESTIRELYEVMEQYSDTDVQVRDVRLHKRVLDREKFNKIADDMGILGGGVTWEDPLPNHPPMVRVQTQLWGTEILDALWDMLPTVGADDTHTGRLDQMRVVLVFLFGMTGMTSSTVGVESAVVLRRKLRTRLLNHRDDDVSDEADAVINSTLDKGSMPLFVGVGCFPPDPTDGAGQYNVLHGLRMSGVIKERLPELKLPRESSLVDKPFNKFFLVDGSGAWRTQDIKEDYSKWVARTVSTLLTCHSVDAAPGEDTFYDSVEMLDSCEPFSHVGLVMAGLMREEQELFEHLRFVQSDAANVDIASNPGPNEALLEQIVNSLNEIDRINVKNEISEELFAPPVIASARDWYNKRAEAVEAERIAVEASETARNMERRQGWWRRLQQRLGGSESSEVSNARAALSDARAAESNARSAEGNARTELRRTLIGLPAQVDNYIEELNREWEKKSHQGIWAMPMPARLWLTDQLQDSLPLRDTGDAESDYNTIQDRNKSRQLTHDMVRMLMRHLIDPMTVHPMEIDRGIMMLVGSNNVKRDYPLPVPEDMAISFGGEWNVLMSEHIEEKNPMHLLLWWRPKDGDVNPLYYRVDESIKVKDLPSEYDAWPRRSPGHQALEQQADAQSE